MIGSWWLLMAIDLTSACASAVTVSWVGNDPYQVEWVLPVSKTDPRAYGVARSHTCICRPPDERRCDCPSHAMTDMLNFLAKRFPGCRVWNRLREGFPLFPDQHGGVCTQEAIVET